MTNYEKREQLRQQTLKTADHHRQLWTHRQDEIVLTRTTTRGTRLSDTDIAVVLGRTQLAVSQRRVLLNKLMETGLTLEEIHEVERHRRAKSNELQYTIVYNKARTSCNECFCTPHAYGCSENTTTLGR